MYTMVRYVFIYMLVPSTNVTVAFSTHAVTPRWGGESGFSISPKISSTCWQEDPGSEPLTFQLVDSRSTS